MEEVGIKPLEREYLKVVDSRFVTAGTAELPLASHFLSLPKKKKTHNFALLKRIPKRIMFDGGLSETPIQSVKVL